MKDKIAILMATYNGEKYVSAQIKSILEQTYNNLDLIIRDDGSTDKTDDIVKSFIPKFLSASASFVSSIDAKSFETTNSANFWPALAAFCPFSASLLPFDFTNKFN